MRKLFIFPFLFFFNLYAQPLLPLFKNGGVAVKVTSTTEDGGFQTYKSIKTVSPGPDTVINNETYSVVLTQKNDYNPLLNQLISSTVTRGYFIHKDNLVMEFIPDRQKADTVLFFHGLDAGDTVQVRSNRKAQIDTLYTINAGTEVLRVFELESRFEFSSGHSELVKDVYIEGIGSVKGGYEPVFSADCRMSTFYRRINCIRFKGETYSINSACNFEKDHLHNLELVALSQDCELPLALNSADEKTPALYYRNSGKEIQFNVAVREVVITSITGRICFGESGPLKQVGLENLQPGMYLITFQTGNKKFTEKFLIVH